jgi:LacI family transcriptional regulator
VTQVLQRAAASRSQLEKKFRRFLGRSPQTEIRRVQVAKIKQLLFETDFPLKKIAELAGFEHVEYMCVVFKRLTGHSPGAYRKKLHVEIPG